MLVYEEEARQTWRRERSYICRPTYEAQYSKRIPHVSMYLVCACAGLEFLLTLGEYKRDEFSTISLPYRGKLTSPLKRVGFYFEWDWAPHVWSHLLPDTAKWWLYSKSPHRVNNAKKSKYRKQAGQNRYGIWILASDINKLISRERYNNYWKI